MVRLTTILLTLLFAPQAPFAAADIRRPSPSADEPPVDTPEEESAEKAGDKEDSKKDEKKKKVEEDRYFALHGGSVHTVTGGVLQGMTILAKNGKIVEINREVDIPEKAEVLDARKYHVYPGLVAAASGSIFGGGEPDDTTNVYSLEMSLGLAGGITTALAGNTAAKLTYGSVDDMIVRRNVFKTLRYATSSPNERRKLREKFDKVRQYLRDLEDFEEKKKTDPDAEPPKKDWIKGEFKTCLDLLQHKAKAKMDALTAQQILGACELAETYGIDIVVIGAVEGWTVPSRMARAGLSAVVTPRRRWPEDDTLNRPTGSSIESPATLYRAGVPIAVVPQTSAITTWGLAGRDLMHLNMEAAFAVRGGLTDEEAIRTITIDAARLLGIDHRVGSIELGKDADFIVTDGDLLHYMTLVQWSVVNGRIVYDKQKDTLFDHIRPDGDLNAPPPNDYWPRSLGAAK